MHVYRWLHEIHKPYFEDYVLNAIKIKNSDVLQYDIEEKGPEILSNSAEILQPGDYCWTPQGRFMILSTFYYHLYRQFHWSISLRPCNWTQRFAGYNSVWLEGLGDGHDGLVGQRCQTWDVWPRTSLIFCALSRYQSSTTRSNISSSVTIP